MHICPSPLQRLPGLLSPHFLILPIFLFAFLGYFQLKVTQIRRVLHFRGYGIIFMEPNAPPYFSGCRPWLQEFRFVFCRKTIHTRIFVFWRKTINSGTFVSFSGERLSTRGLSFRFLEKVYPIQDTRLRFWRKTINSRIFVSASGE